MKDFDVLVVGGGPAGSTAAWRLRRSGFRVAVLDKQRFPRDKVCAGWVTPQVLDILELDPEAYARAPDGTRARVFQPLTGFRTGVLGRPLVEVDYPEPVSYGIRRVEFDHYLLERSGAELHLGQPLKSLEREPGPDGAWVANGALRAPVVIGAGGHFCPVARHLGARPGAAETIVAAHEIEFRMTPEQMERCLADPRVPELYFCPDLKGYGWVFRKEDVLNVGLGREDNHQIGRHVAGFRRYLIEHGRIPEDAPERFKGHAYLLYGRSRRPATGPRVLLAGDALGLAYTQSGEGIRPAVESALMAARVVEETGGRPDEEALRSYERAIESRFGPRSRDTGGAPWVPEGVRQALAGWLLSNRWFAKRVVLDRWFLHRELPPLELPRVAA